METTGCSETSVSHGEDHCSCLHRGWNLLSGIRVRPRFSFVSCLASFLNVLSVWLSSSCWFDHYWDSSAHRRDNILFVNVHVTLWDSKFSHRCCWRFKTSGMWHFSVLNDGSAFVFTVKESNERIHGGLICIPLLVQISVRCHHNYRIIALVHYARKVHRWHRTLLVASHGLSKHMYVVRITNWTQSDSECVASGKVIRLLFFQMHAF